MSLSPGHKLAHYEILEPIGKGGMGEVYRARDGKLGRDVAIKVLPDEFARDTERLARFKREAKVLASLNHPGIAAIYGLEESEGTHYLVLELVPGETLAERISRGPIPIDEAVPLFIQIAEGLEAAHERGIIHRDLKPANAKLTEEGRIKILDFGLAKALAGDDAGAASALSQSPTLSRQATVAGVILGTAAYMSPEQAKGKPVDRRADIWSFGVVLFEMLTGRRLFTGEMMSDVLASVLRAEPDWSSLPTDASPALVKLLRRCLARDPKARLQHIGDARLELTDTVAWRELTAAAPSTGWSRLLPWSLAAFLTLTVFGLLLMRPSKDTAVIRADIAAPPGATFHLESAHPGPPALSPDGSRIAFSARDANGFVRLYVRSLEADETRMLSGSEGAGYPFWSPAGRKIGFFASGLKTIEVVGGRVQTLCGTARGKGGTWNDDGVIVYAPGPAGPLYRVSAEGGKCTPLTSVDREHELSHRYPQFLPDGRHFLYLARTGETGQQHLVAVGSLDGEESKLILHAPAAARYASGFLLYLRERTLVAQPFDTRRLTFTGDPKPVADDVRIISGGTAYAVFTASRNGRLAYLGGSGDSQLEWIDRSGRTVATLGEPAEHIHVSLSPDAERAIAGIYDPVSGTSDLWMYEVGRGVRSRFTFDAPHQEPAVWSPDGSTVAYSSFHNETLDMFRKPVGRPGDETLLLESDVMLYATSWSFDGKLLAFGKWNPQNAIDLWILPVLSGEEPFPFIESRFNDWQGRFSPNGRWIAYTSNESGKQEVYVTGFPGPGEKTLLSTEGGDWPSWSRDGDEIFYRRPSGHVVAVDVDGSGETFVVGAATRLFRVEPGVSTYSSTPDAQRFLIIRPVADDRRALTLIHNWTAELE